MNALFELIISSHAFLNSFDRKGYPVCFSQFEASAKDYFEKLDEGSAEKEAAALLELFSSRYEAFNKRERRDVILKDKQMLALFLTPAAVRFGGAAEAFSDCLCKKWKEHFPKGPYSKGDYDSIMRGFESAFMGFLIRR